MRQKANAPRARLELAVVALGVLLLGLTPCPRAFTEALRQAEAHRANREYGAALEGTNRAARLDPESPLPGQRMGEVLLAQHRWVEATIALREAERLGGGVDAVLALGESYAGRGDWAAAIPTWLRAQALAPDDVRAYVALGRGLIAQGQFEPAARYLTSALQLEPAHPGAHALLGRLLMADDAGAGPPVAQAAEHLRQAGDGDLLAVLEATEAESDPARRALVLGAAFLQRDELTLARQHLERAVALDPTSAEALAYLAHTLDRQGETVAAEVLLTQALELDSESALAYYFLGVHERLVGNVERAQAALEQALQRDPENAALHVELGETLVALGDYAAAEEWYAGAVEIAPENVEFHLILAHFYLDHLYRVAEGGVPAAEAAVDQAPDDARAHDLLGWAYRLAGDPSGAVAELRLALALDPDLVSALYHLGSLYAAFGQREPAREYLQRAADLDTGGYYRLRAEQLLGDLR